MWFPPVSGCCPHCSMSIIQKAFLPTTGQVIFPDIEYKGAIKFISYVCQGLSASVRDLTIPEIRPRTLEQERAKTDDANPGVDPGRAVSKAGRSPGNPVRRITVTRRWPHRLPILQFDACLSTCAVYQELLDTIKTKTPLQKT